MASARLGRTHVLMLLAVVFAFARPGLAARRSLVEAPAPDKSVLMAQPCFDSCSDGGDADDTHAVDVDRDMKDDPIWDNLMAALDFDVNSDCLDDLEHVWATPLEPLLPRAESDGESLEFLSVADATTLAPGQGVAAGAPVAVAIAASSALKRRRGPEDQVLSKIAPRRKGTRAKFLNMAARTLDQALADSGCPELVPPPQTVGGTPLPQDRAVMALRMGAFIRELGGLSLYDEGGPSVAHLLEKCHEFAERRLWLDVVDAQLSRLTDGRCPCLELSAEMLEWPTTKEASADIAGAFKRYLTDTLPGGVEANVSLMSLCAKVASSVAQEISAPAQHWQIRLSFHMFALSLGETGGTWPWRSFNKQVVAAHAHLVSSTGRTPSYVPVAVATELRERGCPALLLRAYSDVQLPEGARPGDTVTAWTPDGEVSLVVPPAELLMSRQSLYAIYRTLTVDTRNVLRIAHMYSVWMQEVGHAIVDIGGMTLPSACYRIVERTLEHLAAG